MDHISGKTLIKKKCLIDYSKKKKKMCLIKTRNVGTPS